MHWHTAKTIDKLCLQREVRDRMHVEQANQLRDDEAACKVIKSRRWLLLGNAGNLKSEQAVKLAAAGALPGGDCGQHPALSVLEGMNSRIKVIKRMVYGYRDTAYFFLKIRTAFPDKVR